MRILGIFLENIRSYKKNIIVFPHRGITVIHGPSGSGKTSLLMSISYALFGIASGSIKSRDLFEAYEHPHGADLLRVDSTRGRVRILISARGRLYVIERWITKEGNSFVSRGGLIEEYTVDQNNLRLASKRQFSSRMEIDEYIASIVGLREKYRERGNPKPLVYPSALYVPQFNVHEVLQLSEEERREIVERALGLDKYKLFRVNYEKISKVLNQRLREAEIKISEVSKRLREKNRESIIKERERLLAEYEKMNRDKNLIELEYRRVKDVDSKLQIRLRELELKRQELLKILDEHDKIRKNISEVKRRICDLFELGSLDEELTAVERIRRELETKLKEFERKKDQLDEGLTSIDKEVEYVEGELKRIREERIKLEKFLSEHETMIKLSEQSLRELESQYREVESMIAGGTCPVCKQPIPHEHGYRLLNEIGGKINSQKRHIHALEEQKSRALGEVSALKVSELDLENRRKSLSSEKQKLLRARDNVLTELRKQSEKLGVLVELINQLRTLREEVSKINAETVTKALTEIENDINAALKELKSTEQEVKALIEKREAISREIGRIEEAIKMLTKELGEIEKLNEELKKVQDEKAVYEKLNQVLDITSQIVGDVEKKLLKVLVSEFRRYFYEYLSMLIYDQPIEINVSDDFNVVQKIRVGRSSYGVPSLSGGQNIAISLAYRLALNTTVRQYSSALKRSVLILDEPTTGFSNELVRRLRDLLRNLTGLEGQIIVVTHDDTLIEAGDCKVTVKLDPADHRTIAEYTECTMQETYKKIVEDILSGRISVHQVQPIELEPSFEPKVQSTNGELTNAEK